MDKKPEKEFLTKLYQLYVEKHGNSTKMLVNHPFTIIQACVWYDVPGLNTVNEDGSMKSKVVEVFEELEHKGFVRRGNGSSFFLTETGFMFVKQGWRGRTLHFLNENPGIAILVSLVAFIVSMVALFK